MLFLIEHFYKNGQSDSRFEEVTSLYKLRERFARLYPEHEIKRHPFGGFRIADSEGRTLVLVTDPTLTADDI